MNKKNVWKYCILACCAIMLIVGIDATQGTLHAEEVPEDSVRCEGTNNCTLSIIYTQKDTLLEQAKRTLASAPNFERMDIQKVFIYPSYTNDAIPENEWTEFKEAILQGGLSTSECFLSIQTLSMENVSIEGGKLWDNAFANTHITDLILPDVTELSANSLKSMSSLKNLTLPETLTTMDVDTLKNTGSRWGGTGIFSRSSTLTILGDINKICESIGGIEGINSMMIHADKISDVNAPILKGTFLDSITLFGEKKINVNLNTWFDVSEADAASNLLTRMTFISTVNGYSTPMQIGEFSAIGFRKLGTLFNGNKIERLVLKNCGFDKIPSGLDALTAADFSGNFLDFTNSRNTSFYDEHKEDANYKFDNQRPNFAIQPMTPFETTTGAKEPEITPTFRYADDSSFDPSDVEHFPVWVDTDYCSTYEDNISYKHSPALDMNVAKEYTRTFYSPNEKPIGEVKIKVVQSTIEKEAPLMELAVSPDTNIDTNTKLTFTATLSQTGTEKNLANNANVKFYDGTTLLKEVSITDDKASISDMVLTQGTHTIKAVYSGNDDFSSVEKTMELTVSTAAKQSQTLSFENSEINVTYGSSVNNPLIKSEESSTGSISYSSSDDRIASVDAETGAVRLHDIGTVTITANISEDALFQAATASYTLTIGKKEITISDLSIKSKEYDGSVQAEIESECTLSGIESGDILVLQVGTAQFSSANAGSQTIQLENFSLTGTDSDKYTLKLPTITAEITKKKAVIQVANTTKSEKEVNPEFTYTVEGLIQGESEDSIHGYQKPQIRCAATQNSPAGDYAIIASGASADNYQFTYINGVLTITANPAADDTESYTLKGTKGKQDWYVSDVTILPSNGYTQIWNGNAWKSSLILSDGMHKEVKFKLRTKDGTESGEIQLQNINVDTIAPVIKQIDEKKQYLLNRLFPLSEDVASVKVDGVIVADVKDSLLLDASASKKHTIVVEDNAGNQTTYAVSTMDVSTYFKDALALKETNVTEQERSLIDKYQKELQDLMNDKNYSPSEQQRQTMTKVQKHLDTLIHTLDEPNDDSNGDGSDDENNDHNQNNDSNKDKNDGDGTQQVTPPTNSVNTGDTHSIIGYVIALFASILLVFLVRKKVNSHRN